MSRAQRATLLMMLPFLWCAVLGSAAAAVYAKYRARTLFVQLEHLSDERDALNDEWGRLQLEQGAWSTYALVERVAYERLHMNTPDPRAIEIVRP